MQTFIEAYQQEILIGVLIAVVVIVVIAVIVFSCGPAAATATATAAAGIASLDSSQKDDDLSAILETTSKILEGSKTPQLKAAMEEEISSLRSALLQEEYRGKEQDTMLHSLFAHKILQNMEKKLPENPKLAQEIQKLQQGKNFTPLDLGLSAIDHQFSTDYASFFANPYKEPDISFLSHYLYGQKALTDGHYEEASFFLGKAIEADPLDPLPYLERATAHLQLGEYERSIEDFETYISYKEENDSFSLATFTASFAKELHRGIYNSGEGLYHFATDLIKHPIHTGQEMWQALHTLSELARSKDWEALGEGIVPEIYQLATEWDTLSSQEKGELAGYAFGKYGSDILIPGSLAKLSSKGAKGLKQLHTARKGFQTAEKTLLLESISPELAQLKKAKYVFEDPSLQRSFELFEDAQNFLRPYGKGYMSETQAKKLLHQAGIKTFPRPKGIPKNYQIQLSDKGAGIKYVHPDHTGRYVRVMPGKPHSPLAYQQKPYVTQLKDGSAFDKFGNKVPPNTPEAHIPIEEFIYREEFYVNR